MKRGRVVKSGHGPGSVRNCGPSIGNYIVQLRRDFTVMISTGVNQDVRQGVSNFWAEDCPFQPQKCLFYEEYREHAIGMNQAKGPSR